MAVFFLGEIKKITDEATYREYIEKAGPIIKQYGGEYIVRSNQLHPLSGDWDLQRIILIRFNSPDQIQKCFQSDEYKKIAPLREHSTLSRAMIIEE